MDSLRRATFFYSTQGTVLGLKSSGVELELLALCAESVPPWRLQITGHQGQCSHYKPNQGELKLPALCAEGRTIMSTPFMSSAPKPSEGEGYEKEMSLPLCVNDYNSNSNNNNRGGGVDIAEQLRSYIHTTTPDLLPFGHGISEEPK